MKSTRMIICDDMWYDHINENNEVIARWSDLYFDLVHFLGSNCAEWKGKVSLNRTTYHTLTQSFHRFPKIRKHIILGVRIFENSLANELTFAIVFIT